MKKSHVALGIVGALVLTVLVVWAASSLFVSGNDQAEVEPGQHELNQQEQVTSGEDTWASTSDGDIAARPDCAATGVAGIDLECLGGENAQQDTQGVEFVNVWAWWCGPCRDELPYIEQYAQENPDVTVSLVHADQVGAAGADMLNELNIDLASYQDDSNKFAGTLGLPGVIPISALVVDGEMVRYFPRTFESADEIDQVVQEALAEIA